MKTKWIIGILIFLVGVLATSTVFMGWRLTHTRPGPGNPMGVERPFNRGQMPPPPPIDNPEIRDQLQAVIVNFRERTAPLQQELKQQQTQLFQAWKTDNSDRVDSLLNSIAQQRLRIAQEAFVTLDSAANFLSEEQQEHMMQRILNIQPGPPPPPRRFKNK